MYNVHVPCNVARVAFEGVKRRGEEREGERGSSSGIRWGCI